MMAAASQISASASGLQSHLNAPGTSRQNDLEAPGTSRQNEPDLPGQSRLSDALDRNSLEHMSNLSPSARHLLAASRSRNRMLAPSPVPQAHMPHQQQQQQIPALVQQSMMQHMQAPAPSRSHRRLNGDDRSRNNSNSSSETVMSCDQPRNGLNATGQSVPNTAQNNWSFEDQFRQVSQLTNGHVFLTLSFSFSPFQTHSRIYAYTPKGCPLIPSI